MGIVELIELLETTYPDTINGIKTQEELIVAKAHLEVVQFVKMQMETKPKKRKK